MFHQEAVKLLDQQEGILVWQDGLLQLFRYLEENRDICLCAMHSLSHEHLRRFFQADIYDIIHRVIDQLTENLHTDEAGKDILTHFYPAQWRAGCWASSPIHRKPWWLPRTGSFRNTLQAL